MLSRIDAHPIVATSDMTRARRFYAETLGLQEDGDGGEQMAIYRTGSTRLTVYVSEFAGGNRANAVVWGMDDGLEAIVADLRAKGVTFERYDFPDTEFEDGVHTSGDMKMAWFKDPDGNILHVVQGM